MSPVAAVSGSAMGIAARRTAWEATLTALAVQPLALCPEFPEIARRWEAWWRFEADRPLFTAGAAIGPAIRHDKAFDLLEQPDAWLAVRRRQVEQTRCFGEAIPSIRVDLGPVATAAFIGAEVELSAAAGTVWQHPVASSLDWFDGLTFDPDNRWLQMVVTLAEATARDAAGNYVVCLPDLTGAIDAMANLRGPEGLLFDTIDDRDRLRAAAARIVDIWEAVYAILHETILGQSAGIIQWLGCWSKTLYTLPTCDFNFMIGPDDFAALCMPSLKEQARRAGRCVFHLDGPGASRHADCLAADPDITAVQYTPGAGTPSALAKLEMLQRLQAAGKPIIIHAPLAEVPTLIEQLDHRGLMVLVGGVTEAQGEELTRMMS